MILCVLGCVVVVANVLLHICSVLPVYQPPLPPFFFFWGAFLRAPGPVVAGFCCRGGTTLLAAGAEVEAEAWADPGRGEVGGLLAVLLASLETQQNEVITSQMQHTTGKRVPTEWIWNQTDVLNVQLLDSYTFLELMKVTTIRDKDALLTGRTRLLTWPPACLYPLVPSSCPSSCPGSRCALSWAAISPGQGSPLGRSSWAVCLDRGRRKTVIPHPIQRCWLYLNQIRQLFGSHSMQIFTYNTTCNTLLFLLLLLFNIPLAVEWDKIDSERKLMYTECIEQVVCSLIKCFKKLHVSPPLFFG